MKRKLRLHFNDGTHEDLEIKGLSTLPNTCRRSLAVTEDRNGKFHISVSESLIEDFTTLKSIEVIRE